jgi:hypothetical protein
VLLQSARAVGDPRASPVVNIVAAATTANALFAFIFRAFVPLNG